MTPSVLIIGYGVVGRNLAKELAPLNPEIYDKYKTEFNTKSKDKYDFAFICVDTPLQAHGACDGSAVVDAILENNADIFVIKSTLTPNTFLDVLDQTAGKKDFNIVVSPEYYGGTQHCNNFDFNFTILGGEFYACNQVQQLLQEVYDARHTFHQVSWLEAILAKYMENCWLATKVAFCNAFYDIVQRYPYYGDYDRVRELFILDPRVNPSHTFVYKDHPYYDSHCLNKDVPAIANEADSDFLKFIIDWNERRKPHGEG